jgi:hypothetical protein
MLSAKKILLIGTSLVAMSAQAVVCEVNMVRGNGNLIQPFRAQSVDERMACREAQKACRLDLRIRQRAGRNRQASCQKIGVVASRPTPTTRPIPGPTRPTIPRPNPRPTPQVGNFDFELDRLAQTLSNGDWRSREYAAQSLVRYPSARAIAMAIKALNDNDSDVRNAVNRSLTELISLVDMSYESISLMQQLTPMLNSGGWKQRQAAAKILGLLGTAEPIIPLISAMNDNDADVRNAVKHSINTMMQAYDLKQVVRQNKDVFASLTTTGGWKSRQIAVQILGVAKLPATIVAAVKAIGDNDTDVRNAAIAAMRSISSARNFTNLNIRLIDELAQLTRSGNWKVRMHAVETLGNTYNYAARDAVLRALDDNDADVRNAARVALGKL